MKPSVISNQVPAVRCTNSGKCVLYHSVSKLLGAPDWGLQVRHATAHVHNLLQLSFTYVIARCNSPRGRERGRGRGRGRGQGRGRGPVLSGQTGNNQSRSPLWNTIIIFSCSIYLHLFEIPIYLWLRSIGDAIEFHFAFRSKITWNYIFEAANCRRIMLISSLSEERQ